MKVKILIIFVVVFCSNHFLRGADFGGNFIHYIPVESVGPPSCTVISYNACDEAHAQVLNGLNTCSHKDEVGLLKAMVEFFDYGFFESGSGFFVDKEGYILTRLHCLGAMNDNLRVVVLWSNEFDQKRNIMEAIIVEYSDETDMVLLKLAGNYNQDFPVVKLGHNHPTVEHGFLLIEKAVLVDSRLGLYFSVSEVEINGIRTGRELNFAFGPEGVHYDSGTNYLQIGGNADLGSSGGGVFNFNGELIGIIDAIKVCKAALSLSGQVNYCSGTAFATTVDSFSGWLKESLKRAKDD